LEELKIESSEFRMGRTKLFVKSAKTLFRIEQARLTILPTIAIQMQALYRGWETRKWIKERRSQLHLINAANKIQLFYVKYVSRKYFGDLRTKFENAKELPNFGKHVDFPKAPNVLNSADSFLKEKRLMWWAMSKIMSLTVEERGKMRQKVLSLTLFKDKKPWNPSRNFEGDYLVTDNNPLKQVYKTAVQQMFAASGDTAILFSEDCDKVNPKGKIQLRSIIVSNAHIYKYDPKKYKMKKNSIPLNKVKSISMSPTSDTYVVIHMEPPIRDMVIDLGKSGVEKVSEFVSVVYAQIMRLKDQYNDDSKPLEINFVDKIQFNNNRNEAGKSAGKEKCLNFQKNPAPTGAGCVFKKAGDVWTVLY